jgi:hypothetical protein
MPSSTDFDFINELEFRRELGGSQSPISRSTLWRGIKSGHYAAPIRVSPNSVRWLRGAGHEAVRKINERHGAA